jgi:hypothetical protein
MSVDFAERKRQRRQKNLSQWEAALRGLFPDTLPTHHAWVAIDEIIRVLNRVGSAPSVNLAHAFIPTGGGFHFRGAQESAEPGCIELLSDGNTYVLRIYP